MSTPRTESNALVLRTAALWGTFVLAARDLESGESLAVGDGADALIAKPDESPVSELPIRSVGNGWELDPRGATGGLLHLRGREEDPAQLSKSGAPVPIVAGDYGVLQYGTLSVFFQFAHPAPVPKARWRPDIALVLAFVFAVLTLGGGLMLLYLLFPQQDLPKPLELTSPEELQKTYHFTPPPPEPSGGKDAEGAAGAKTKEPKPAAGAPKHAPGPKTPHQDAKPSLAPGGAQHLSAITEVMQGAVGKEVLDTLGTISSVSDALGGLRSSGIQLGGRSGGNGLHASGDGGGHGGSALFGGGALETGDGSGAGATGNGRGRSGRGHGLGNGTGDGEGNGHGERHLQAATASVPGSGLSPEQIRRIVEAHKGVYRACYETAVAREPTLQGGVTVSFTITPAGGVTDTRISNTSLNNGRVESCLLRIFNRLKFPAADKATNANYPLLFRPGKQ